MFVSETKIDFSFPNAQFSIPGYSLYRNDREKGGGGILALISTALSKTRLKLNKGYKTLEFIAFDVKTETGNMVVIGVYRPESCMRWISITTRKGTQSNLQLGESKR